MILNTAPQHEAVLSNVDQIGEFRIRNSAKAFNILSSGLYANKIRAIIRELSCNAVDSHVAAGKADVPFEVHLPTALEPHFSIRDFGTGLTHDQVTNIYTTYFESTKTDSNSFIGALGLGSKSPFSYTDNFSVIAYKDGKFGIYSAFINENGVPSIALMTSGETDEPNGIEVKFSVNNRMDFSKFVSEAHIVYRYFKLIPIVKGVANFKLDQNAVPYETKDIIPGVHSLSNTFNPTASRSVAVMGNIAYPIQVPNASENLGTLTKLLDHGYEMHFDIGELDFQASREGLSYVPMTIQSIKKKLIELEKQLDYVLKRDAYAISNMWQRIVFLQTKNGFSHWQSSVDKYLTEIGLAKKAGPYSSSFPIMFTLKEQELEEKYNIRLRGTERVRGVSSMRTVKFSNEIFHDPASKQPFYASALRIGVDAKTQFIINDTTKGGFERVKYHYRKTQIPGHSQTIYLIDPVDKTKPVLVDEFFEEIKNPPTENIKKLSELEQKPRNSSHSKDVSILRFDIYVKRHRTETTWMSDKKLESFSDTDKFYYLPLSGFKVISEHDISVKELSTWLKTSEVDELKNIIIYGVRKADLENVKQKSNWINLEKHITVTLSSIDKKVFKRMVVNELPRFSRNFHNTIAIKNANSMMKKVCDEFKGIDATRYQHSGLLSLYNIYGKSINVDPVMEMNKYKEMISAVMKQYPLLSYLYGASNDEVTTYINLIDDSLNQKGI